jgi:alginate O-acetyltransferase complex protein AlgI
MLFNSLLFPFFFFVVYGLYLVLNHRRQNLLLLAASYVFYAAWDWRFLSLLALSTIVDFHCGRKIDSASPSAAPQNQRRHYLILSLFTNLSLLATFKYYDFFVSNLQDLLRTIGVDSNLETLQIVVPVGISFYTFQTLSYSLDIYRRRISSVDRISDFALFVAFFPQLVAGPIERARTLLPQLMEPRRITVEDLRMGCWLVLFGYFMKVYVADNLAFAVDYTYSKEGHVPSAEVLSATYAFAFQIFGDFAGYSSIAIGISRLMGIRLMTNFRFPYFVTNPQEFWKHWHISLSTWLRDYLYISLGGNKNGTFATYRNLFVTMFLGGIWHGAAWNFVLWGIYQGGILIVHRLAHGRLMFLSIGSAPIRWLVNLVLVVFMFHVTCYGWLLFRARSGQQIIDLSTSLVLEWPRFADPVPLYNLKSLLVFAGPLVIIQLFGLARGDDAIITRLPKWALAAIYTLMIGLTVLFGEFGSNEFIYFQF